MTQQHLLRPLGTSCSWLTNDIQQLRDLPNEVIQILLTNITHPACLVDFVTTCRQIYDLAGARLVQHRKLRDRFGRIGIHTYQAGDATEYESGAECLYDLHREPDAALYVRYVAFFPGDIDMVVHAEEPDEEASCSSLMSSHAGVDERS